MLPCRQWDFHLHHAPGLVVCVWCLAIPAVRVQMVSAGAEAVGLQLKVPLVYHWEDARIMKAFRDSIDLDDSSGWSA